MLTLDSGREVRFTRRIGNVIAIVDKRFDWIRLQLPAFGFAHAEPRSKRVDDYRPFVVPLLVDLLDSVFAAVFTTTNKRNHNPHDGIRPRD